MLKLKNLVKWLTDSDSTSQLTTLAPISTHIIPQEDKIASAEPENSWTNDNLLPPALSPLVANQSYQERLRQELQTLFDNPPIRQVLKLIPQEYPGPLFIKKAILIDGQGATLWALQGPVLHLNAPTVALKNLNIEVTGEQFTTPQSDCAICIENATAIHFENVHIRGQVLGLTSEEGEWHYPHSLPLGHLTSNTPHQFLLRIMVPTVCTLESAIDGVHLSPTQLAIGPNEIILHIDPLRHDTCLYGSLYLNTSLLKRRIHLTAYCSTTAPSKTTTGPTVIWSPAVWPEISEIPATSSDITPQKLESENTPLNLPTTTAPLATSSFTVTKESKDSNADWKPVENSEASKPGMVTKANHLSVANPKREMLSQIAVPATSIFSAPPVNLSAPQPAPTGSKSTDNIFLKTRSTMAQAPAAKPLTPKSSEEVETEKNTKADLENIFLKSLKNH